jgi:site-specific DNA-methyltransferase (adenine-specific)
MSSTPGDVVLDPFCGCGTAIAAAQKLGRRWMGIDITHLSIALQKYRLESMFGLKSGADYQVLGEPQDLASAQALAKDSDNDGRYQFQWWALSLVRAKPLGQPSAGSKSGKKGSDKGVDGVINFIEAGGKPAEVLVQVKSGDVRDLRGATERRGSAIGVFITLEEPSRDMKAEAASAGMYVSKAWSGTYPKLQILTIEQLLNGAGVQMPSPYGTFKQADKVQNLDVPQTINMFGE